MKTAKSLILLFSIAILMLTYTGLGYAKNIRIITPYLGSIKNVYNNEEYDLDLEDSSLMKGLFLQWINTERYQWNVFIYQSSDINYSTLWGGHFIFDYYPGSRKDGKWVIGGGIEIISLDMDAGNNISGLYDFQLNNNIYVPYARMGRYFYLGGNHVRISLLPWAGVQPEWVRGDISFNFGGPSPPVHTNIRDEELYALLGINTRATVFHFLEIEAKYNATFNERDYFSTVSGMTNLFFTRYIGVSYRYKYMETSSGSNTYHIGGLAIMF